MTREPDALHASVSATLTFVVISWSWLVVLQQFVLGGSKVAEEGSAFCFCVDRFAH